MDNCLYPCKPHPRQSIQKTAHYPQIFLCLFAVFFLPKEEENSLSSFCHYPLVLCVLELHVNGFTECILWCLAFLAQHNLSKSQFLRFIHAVVYVDSFFSFSRHVPLGECSTFCLSIAIPTSQEEASRWSPPLRGWRKGSSSGNFSKST